MPRLALKIEYQGKKFAGSQFQKGHRTVQSELERALRIFLRIADETAFRITLSGRTDAGVSAAAQVVHFDYDERARVKLGLNVPVSWQCDVVRAHDTYDLSRLCTAINGICYPDLSVICAQVVPADFHARFSATGRTYVYRILNRQQRSALMNNTHYYVHGKMNIDTMAEAAKRLIGRHDFLAFKSTSTDPYETVCQVKQAEILNLGEGKLEFWISADHFVYNMVRIIVGTLVEIGLGKRPASDLEDALQSKQRYQAGPTAPPWGLCLQSVQYPQHFNLFAGE